MTSMFSFKHQLIDIDLPKGLYAQTVLADLDNDGRPEFIVGQQYGTVYWYKYRPTNKTWSRYLLGKNSPSDVGACAFDVDGDGWLKSMQQLEKVILDRISELDEEDSERQSIELLYKLRYGAIEFNSENFWLAYQRHQKEVIEYFSERPNDLLTINITAGEGWEKLCPFLQVTIPKIPFPHKHRWQELKGWHDLRKAALTDLETLIPEKGVFILVDEDQLKLDQLRRKRNDCLPFLEKNGQYWGLPSDSKIAIDELERMRQEGATFIAFVWLSFWWLDFYTEFNQYLHSKFSCVLDNEHLIVFDLKHELQTHIFPEKPDRVEA